jgi:hypothetical protein
MTFAELLQDNKDAIAARWLDDLLASYGEEGSAAFRRGKDPFANPVGQRLRTGTQAIFEALLEGADAEKIREQFHEIVKIRAVQEFTASQAVGFVFQLKAAVRAELGGAAGDPKFAFELAQLDGRIDRLTLAAFDVFVQCREQLCQLRINEVKRQVSWILDKMNQRGFGPEPSRTDPP